MWLANILWSCLHFLKIKQMISDQINSCCCWSRRIYDATFVANKLLEKIAAWNTSFNYKIHLMWKSCRQNSVLSILMVILLVLFESTKHSFGVRNENNLVASLYVLASAEHCFKNKHSLIDCTWPLSGLPFSFQWRSRLSRCLFPFLLCYFVASGPTSSFYSHV